MRFAVDAHAIGRHLTGNEVYVRSLLNALASQLQDDELVAYVSADSAAMSIPSNIRTRRVGTNPFLRLGFELGMRCRQDRPDLLHVQYTAPLACPVPIVVSVHDVSFLEHPEYFTRDRAIQLQFTVRRTVHRAARILTGSEFSKSSILKVYGDLDEHKVVVESPDGERLAVTPSVAETVSVIADPSPPPRTALPEQLVLGQRYGR